MKASFKFQDASESILFADCRQHCTKGYRVITFWSSSAEEMRIRCMVSMTCNSWLLRHRFPSASENTKSSIWARPWRGISYLTHTCQLPSLGGETRAQALQPQCLLHGLWHCTPLPSWLLLPSCCILPFPKCLFWCSLITQPEGGRIVGKWYHLHRYTWVCWKQEQTQVLWLPKGIWWGEGEVPSRMPVKRVIVLIDHSENTLLL